MKTKYVIVQAQIIISLISCYNNSLAYDDSDFLKNFGFGISGYYYYAANTIDKNLINECNSCNPSFPDVMSNNYGIGCKLFVDLNKYLGVECEFLFQSFLADFSKTEIIGAINENGELLDVKLLYKLETQIQYFTPKLKIFLKLFDNLKLSGGLAFHYPLGSSLYSIETIVEPKDYGTFPDGKRTKNEYSGSIPNLSKNNIIFQAEISYSFPISYVENLYIVPNIMISFAQINTSVSDGWNFLYHGIGVSIEYDY